MQLNFGFMRHRTRMVQLCYTFEETDLYIHVTVHRNRFLFK